VTSSDENPQQYLGPRIVIGVLGRVHERR
jgi:hypothetical protein